MRRYILTSNDRERLLKWLLEDIEDQQTRNLFSQIRKNITPIREDLQLILRVIRKLRSERRWAGRASYKDEFGEAILRASSMVDSLKRYKRKKKY